MGGALPASPLSVDIDRVLGDLNSSFNPLHRDFLLDFHVSGARDGYVFLTIALPEGMTRVFVSMLESMAGFFRFIDIKSRSAMSQAKAHDPGRRLAVEKSQADFQDQVCALFDDFTRQGHDRKTAVRLTNSALKGQNHPWASYETITQVLRSSGRFRKSWVCPSSRDRPEPPVPDRS